MFRRFLFPALLLFCACAFAQIPSFPGAEGYGSTAAGGRGGDVYVVTNRNASGAGSFAEAVQTAPVEGRTIVFAVSGHIRLPSGSGGGLSIAKSKITVAGQTAPGDGICFWNNTMNLTGDDIVIRHVRWRYGKQAAGGDAVDISGSQRIILDHCDVMFATDENLSSFGTPPEYFTFQWSINAWGLSGHSAGGLWDVDHATSHHSLWANNHTRNPKLIAPSVFDWTNNVTFGWDIGFNMAQSPEGGTGYIHRVNVRGSTFVHGGDTTQAIFGGGTNADATNKFKLHMSDSALDGNNNGVLDVSRTNYSMVFSTSYDQVATPWPQTINGVTGGTAIGVPVTLDARLTAYKKVLSHAGAVRTEYDAARPLRDEITELCVTRAAALQRGIISDPLELGLSTGTALASLNSTTAPTDTDKDGMPDIWENALGMNAAVQSHNTVFASSGGFITGVTFFPASTPAGYTHLEEYLHFKAQPHALLPKNTAAVPSFIDVDLARYTSGFTSGPVFTIANVTGGSATQSGSGGRIVRFTPTQNTFGRAWFDFTVTDSAGSSWTQRFCMLVSASAIQRDLVWAGNGTTNPWDISTTVWARSGAATSYNDGDFVSFNDGGSASPALTLNGTLQPASVLVDASDKSYTFNGPGIIGGATTLTKRGSGTLTLKSNNTYTGGTTVEDGSLVLGTLGTASNSSGDIGPGQLTLLGNSSLVNAWVGTQHIFAAPMSVPADSTPTLYTSRSIRWNGALTGDGTLTIVNQGTAGSVELAGPWNAFAGTLRIVYAGTNGIIRAIFNGASFNGFGGATLDLGGGNIINPTTNSGGNIFNIGALTSTASDAVLNGGSAGAPTYTIGALNTSTTFAGRFQGNAKLTKVGTGTLTLTGASTHTGATAVNAGALAVNGSFGTSAVTVASGAAIAGGGSLAGTVNVSSGGIVQPSGILTTGALTMATPTLYFSLSNSPLGNNDRISAGAAAVALSGAHTLVLTMKDGFLGAGAYPLISTTGPLSAGSATFAHNLTNTPRQSYAIQVTPTAVNLVVTGSPVTLAWKGAETQWDIATTSSWLNGATTDIFYDADAVTFTDAATNGTVTLATNAAPRSVLVNNTAARAFSIGGASIAGETAFTKSGTGTVTLNAANTFTGGTILNDGTIQLANATANASALGSGEVTMAGGVLKMFSAGNGTHAGTLPNALNISGNSRLEVAPRCGFSGAVSGAGTLEYRTNYVRADVTGDWSAFTGQLNATTTGAGDFRIASSYSWPGLPNASVNLASGIYFYMSGIVNSGAGTTISIGALSGASGSHLRGGPTGDRTLTYRIGGKGTNATFSGDIGEQGTGTTTAIVKTGTGIWNLGGPATHRGNTIVESGTLCLLPGGSITNTALINVQSGAAFWLNGGSASVESLTISSDATFSSTGGTFTGEFTNDGTASVTAGTLSITGNVTNRGTFRVSGGAQLAVNGTFTNSGVLDLLTSSGNLPANFTNAGIVIQNTQRTILNSAKSGSTFSVNVFGYTGHTYQLQRADTPGGTWTNLGAAVPGAGTILTLTDSGGAAPGARFYRVFVSP